MSEKKNLNWERVPFFFFFKCTFSDVFLENKDLLVGMHFDLSLGNIQFSQDNQLNPSEISC